LVGAIATRSLPSSLAAAWRGFTFYLADPSARLTAIALGGSGEPPLPAKAWGAFVFAVAAEPALSEVQWACRLHSDFGIAVGTRQRRASSACLYRRHPS